MKIKKTAQLDPFTFLEMIDDGNTDDNTIVERIYLLKNLLSTPISCEHLLPAKKDKNGKWVVLEEPKKQSDTKAWKEYKEAKNNVLFDLEWEAYDDGSGWKCEEYNLILSSENFMLVGKFSLRKQHSLIAHTLELNLPLTDRINQIL